MVQDDGRTFGEESDINGNVGIQQTPPPLPSPSPSPPQPQQHDWQALPLSLKVRLNDFWTETRSLFIQAWDSFVRLISWGVGILVSVFVNGVRSVWGYFWRVLRYWKWMALALVIVLILPFCPMPPRTYFQNDADIYAIPKPWGPDLNLRSYGRNIKHNIGQYVPYFSKHPLSYLSDPDIRDIQRRIENLEFDVSHLQSLQRINSKEIKVLENKLPDTMALRVDSHGNPQISNEFWKAIRNQPLWEDYLQRVEGIVEKKVAQAVNLDNIILEGFDIEGIVEKKVTQAVHHDNIILEGLHNYDVVTKDKVIDLIKERYEADLEKIRKQYHSVAHLQTELGVQLEALASLSDQELLSKTSKSLNFFSPKAGAVIDDINTSPTYIRIDHSANRFKRFLAQTSGRGFGPKPQPPIEALQPWSEHGDCWCSPSNTSDPKNNPPALGVKVGRKLYPQNIVVEHPGKSAIVNPGTIAKDFEVYAQLEDYMPNKLATTMSRQLFSRPIEYPFGPEFIKIAEFTYDAHSPNHNQVFPVQVNLQDLARPDVDTSTHRIVVRMMENYGNGHVPYTCLYRVLLHAV